MTVAARTLDEAGMSAQEFRTFQERQPDGQRWELVAGVPVMMTPPKVNHQKIAWNLTRLLNEALAVHDPSLIAVFPPGIDLGLGSEVLPGLGKALSYVPEPDVAVIGDDPDPDARIVGAARLLAEVVSSTDEVAPLRGGRPWIDVKAALYRQHAPCRAVLVVEQERGAARLRERIDETWSEGALAHADAILAMEC